MPAVNEEREKLILLVENDIDAMGWDIAPRLYGVTENSDNEEYLELITELDGHPADFLEMAALVFGHITRRAIEHGNLRGVVLSVEGWTYPEGVLLPEMTREQIEEQWRVQPPSKHPDRKEIRTVTMCTADGEVHSIVRQRDAGILPRDGVEFSGRVINAMRALIGLDPIESPLDAHE